MSLKLLLLKAIANNVKCQFAVVYFVIFEDTINISVCSSSEMKKLFAATLLLNNSLIIAHYIIAPSGGLKRESHLKKYSWTDRVTTVYRDATALYRRIYSCWQSCCRLQQARAWQLLCIIDIIYYITISTILYWSLFWAFGPDWPFCWHPHRNTPQWRGNYAADCCWWCERSWRQ